MKSVTTNQEQAGVNRESTNSVSKKAYFNILLPDAAKILSQPDGSLIVKDVPIMAEGTWESMQGVNATFTAPVLQASAGNWQDNPLWLRHPGVTSRAVNECVGSIINPHYDTINGVNAVYGDLYIHGRTACSRDAQALVQMPEEQGGIKSISAETILDVDDTQSYGTPFQVSKITFTGAALVRHGACETCKLPAFSDSDESGETADMEKDSKQKTPPAPPASGTSPAKEKGSPPSPDGAPQAGPSMEDIKAAISDAMSLKDVMSAIDGLGKKFDDMSAKFAGLAQPQGGEACHLEAVESDEEEEPEEVEPEKKETIYSKELDELKAAREADKTLIADLQAKLAKRKTNKSVPTTLAQPEVKSDDSVSVHYAVRMMDKHNFEIGKRV